MSEPIFVLNVPELVNMDMSTNITSPVMDLGEVGGFAVHSIFTGSPVGSLQVEASNTQNASDFIPMDTYAVTAAGKRLINVEKTHYKYIRITYTFTSGTGSLTSYVSAKRI